MGGHLPYLAGRCRSNLQAIAWQLAEQWKAAVRNWFLRLTIVSFGSMDYFDCVPHRPRFTSLARHISVISWLKA